MRPDDTIPIPGYPGYFITRDGRVWSERGRHRRGHWLRPRPERGGYLCVGLYRSGVQRHITVHALVLLTFVGPRPAGMIGRHLDDNPLNNHADNLAWGTYADNAADSIRNGTKARGERSGQAKLTAETVRAIRAAVASGEDRKAVAARYDITNATISHIVLRQTWAHV